MEEEFFKGIDAGINFLGFVISGFGSLALIVLAIVLMCAGASKVFSKGEQ